MIYLSYLILHATKLFFEGVLQGEILSIFTLTKHSRPLIFLSMTPKVIEVFLLLFFFVFLFFYFPSFSQGEDWFTPKRVV